MFLCKIKWCFLYENGFTNITQDSSTITATGRYSVFFIYDESNGNIVLINNIFFLQGNTYDQQSNRCLFLIMEALLKLLYNNYQGQYMLRIFGGPAGSSSYPQMAEYTIQRTKTADVPLGFPTVYGLYSNYVQLFKPLYNPLTKIFL